MRGIRAKATKGTLHKRLDIRQKQLSTRSVIFGPDRKRMVPIGKHPQIPQIALKAASPPKRYLNRQPTPMIQQSFTGVTDTGWRPPDTMGAAGLNHLVSVVNGKFAIFNKTNCRLMKAISLQRFWEKFGTAKGQPAWFVYDPKVIYDHFSSRFLIVSLGGQKSVENPGSWYLLSISAPNDPFVWNQWAITSDSTGPTWSDYPGIGYDRSNVYLTANMFQGDAFQYVKVWVIPKGQLLNGKHIISLFYFTNPPGSMFTTQPAALLDTSSNGQYMISVLDSQTLKINRIAYVNGTPLWFQISNVSVARFNATVPDVPQLGTTRLLETNDSRMLNAVFRQGSIYAVHHVGSQDGKRTEVAWYQIIPGRTSPVQQGRVRSNTFSYFYPSIAVNRIRDIMIGFSGSSPNQYASAYFTDRRITDPVGTVRPVTLLKAGSSPYMLGRWGDFSATVVDTNGTSFWTIQEIAGPQGTWRTWWGKIQFAKTGQPLIKQPVIQKRIMVKL